MYCYDNSTDDYYTGASSKALQDEGFGIYASNTNCPTTSRSSQFNSSNDVSYDSPDPAIGTKVVCAYPVAVIWQNILGYLVLAYAITQFFRPVTWCKGYKYNKKCALYIFVYDEDHERYSPLKIMSLKGQMHNYRMKYTGEGISLTLVRSWTYDTMTISWGGVQVMDKSDPINLPATVTVALRHKIMTRRIAQQLGEVQYMLKQGSSWHDITDYYRARKKAVNLKS